MSVQIFPVTNVKIINNCLFNILTWSTRLGNYHILRFPISFGAEKKAIQSINLPFSGYLKFYVQILHETFISLISPKGWIR